MRAVGSLVIWLFLKAPAIGGLCLVFLVIDRGDLCGSGISLSCLLVIEGAGVVR